MTTPSIISITTITSSSTSSSQSVTVPSGTTLALLITSFWVSGGVNFSSVTLNGSALTELQHNTGSTGGQSNLRYLNAPTIGSQTFAWTWNAALTEGARFYLIWIQNSDSTSPITGSNKAEGGAPPTTATTPSFSSNATDLVVGGGYSYGDGNDPAINISGQTADITDTTAFNSVKSAVGHKAGSAGTTTFSLSGSYPALVAVSIKEYTAPSGVTGTVSETLAVASTTASASVSGTPANSRGDGRAPFNTAWAYMGATITTGKQLFAAGANAFDLFYFGEVRTYPKGYEENFKTYTNAVYRM